MSEEKVIEALEEAIQKLDNKITLSTGVVLLAKKANPLTMIKVMAAHPRPKPPMWQHPTMGRMMENPDDPDYQGRLQAHEMEQTNATLNAFILLGTELVNTPKGFGGPHPTKNKTRIGFEKNDDGKENKKKPVYKEELVWPDWIEEYELLGVPMLTQNKSWRYLTWVTFKAIADEDDLKMVQDTVGRLSGMTEKSVQAAEEFPGRD